MISFWACRMISSVLNIEKSISGTSFFSLAFSTALLSATTGSSFVLVSKISGFLISSSGIKLFSCSMICQQLSVRISIGYIIITCFPWKGISKTFEKYSFYALLNSRKYFIFLRKTNFWIYLCQVCCRSWYYLTDV